jgi:hypothetical protein
MKVGLSYSRCVRDIVDGVVDIKDVLVVITRTDFDPHDDDQWKGIWEGYAGGSGQGSLWSHPEWYGYTPEDETRFRKVSIELWEQGKFHQPRKFGARPQRMPYYWLEVGLQTEDIERNASVKKAWEQFQIIAGLANTNKIKDDF